MVLLLLLRGLSVSMQSSSAPRNANADLRYLLVRRAERKNYYDLSRKAQFLEPLAEESILRLFHEDFSRWPNSDKPHTNFVGASETSGEVESKLRTVMRILAAHRSSVFEDIKPNAEEYPIMGYEYDEDLL